MTLTAGNAKPVRRDADIENETVDVEDYGEDREPLEPPPGNRAKRSLDGSIKDPPVRPVSEG